MRDRGVARETVEVPKRIQIPKIGVDEVIEPVGLDTHRDMDIPHDPNNTGWYSLGAKPGERGSAVIDGHLDLADGSPSVFWNLKNLSKGDEIIISGTTGKKYNFFVTDIETYPYNMLPLRQIFAATDTSRLNLITCGGTWDSASKNYSNRIVVYSTKNTIPSR